MIKHKINQEIMQLVFFQREDYYLPICAQSWSILTMTNKEQANDEDIRILNMNFGIFIYYLDRNMTLVYNYLPPTSTKGWRNPSYRERDMSRRLEKIISELK
jgi:hypothetical protein